jgi:pimeloyl-ACP methyl ester carboxylesterase
VKRIFAVLATAALSATVLGTGTAQAAVAAAAPARAAVYTPPPLVWAPCPASLEDLQCATLVVPLNYNKPTGTKIRLAVSRAVHTSSDYKGVMLVNPGGPGAPGTGMPYLQQYVPNHTGEKYDWIGWDPRGVGSSTPALHCNNHYDTPDRPSFVPIVPRLLTYWLGHTKKYAKACGRSAAKELLPHMKTTDTVADMESLRIALGVAKISYYGFSYGTYLGQVYATLHPGQVDKMIFDGVVNPHRVWYGANLDQDVQFDRNITTYFKYLAKHHTWFHLGTSWRSIKAGYYKEIKKLRKHPSASGRLGPDELTDGMLGAGYYVYGWNETGKAYAALIHHNKGAAMYHLYADGVVGDDNGFATYNATQCTDVSWPGWAKTKRDTIRVNRLHPFLTWDNTWYNAPCLNWPAKSGTKVKIRGSRVTSKVLLINETDDAATPYSGALTVRSMFPTASLIQGVGGTTHAGSLSGVACTDDAISTYLETGVTPTRKAGRRADLNCPPVPPSTDPNTGRMAVAGGMPANVRAILIRAQALGERG